MSAQCTDARVNIVTADLFQKYDTLEKFAMADLKELEQDIHSIGFYHMKAKNIIACCRDLVERFGGEVPKSIDELTSLPAWDVRQPMSYAGTYTTSPVLWWILM